MKKHLPIIVLITLGFGLLSAPAQFGPRSGAPSGPNFGGATGKLFGDNQAFTARLELQSTTSSGDDITMPGKISFDSGKSRFEMSMAEMKGAKMKPGTAAQMKSMGLDQIITISRPDKKSACLIYPGLASYVDSPVTQTEAAPAPGDYKIETTELGKDTVDGHDCVKNKVIVTDKDGNKHESTVWNATDLKNFPVKIQSNEGGQSSTMLFKDVSLERPDASVFEVPSGYTKYDDMPTMMRTEMMKKMVGGMGMPGH